jgi:hypothetical protein
MKLLYLFALPLTLGCLAGETDRLTSTSTQEICASDDGLCIPGAWSLYVYGRDRTLSQYPDAVEERVSCYSGGNVLTCSVSWSAWFVFREYTITAWCTAGDFGYGCDIGAIPK